MSTDLISIHAVEAKTRLRSVSRVILVGSGKGGVGKSLVASGLGLALASKDQRVGILDLDLHGASLTNYLGVDPPVSSGKDGITPKLVGKARVMSVALFTGNNPVPMRDNKKQELITQLFSLTNWERLDFLVVDLPPGTGDELFTAFKLFEGKCSLILVTTPSPNSVMVVSRLRHLAESERIPVKGIAINMAYIKQGRMKVPLFGRLDEKGLEKKLKSKIIGEIPLEPRVSSTSLESLLSRRILFSRAFAELAQRVLEQAVDV